MIGITPEEWRQRYQPAKRPYKQGRAPAGTCLGEQGEENLLRVLIKQGGISSRPELARLMGVAPISISHITRRLKSKGKIEKVGVYYRVKGTL
jgi:hypothetical protein